MSIVEAIVCPRQPAPRFIFFTSSPRLFSFFILRGYVSGKLFCFPAWYGDEGDRTPDLLVANQALSQLSYIPRTQGTRVFKDQFQWAYLDSNQGPQLYQSCALAN